jgi:16S rRNA (adenine1518-N6/adenine1519-N6)-dimethyltransferase
VVRLGQNFLADPNLLEAIVRQADLDADDVVLEVGGGEGVLSEQVAPRVARLWVVELDQGLRGELEALAERRPNVGLLWGDALHVDLGGLDPAPTAMVANLPYSIATPLLIKTIAELPGLERWTVMVQREVADRLRAQPGTKAYGSPSAVVQTACRVELLRVVDPAVFKPRPRVESALLRLERTGPWPGDDVERVVRGAFAHRRKALARSLGLAGVASRDEALAALGRLGIREDARAEMLAPGEFVALARELAG